MTGQCKKGDKRGSKGNGQTGNKAGASATRITSKKSKKVSETALCRLLNSSTTVLCENAKTTLAQCLSIPTTPRRAQRAMRYVSVCVQAHAWLLASTEELNSVPVIMQRLRTGQHGTPQSNPF
eukprot:1134602-Pelagomonas_calceolata.AAC.6